VCANRCAALFDTPGRLGELGEAHVAMLRVERAEDREPLLEGLHEEPRLAWIARAPLAPNGRHTCHVTAP
jgi:hypothetical protein